MSDLTSIQLTAIEPANLKPSEFPLTVAVPFAQGCWLNR